MQNGAVLCALGFFLKSARAVVDVPALKQKATIGSKNIPAGKASRFIQVVIDSLSRLAILASRGRDCFVVCVVKFVNCTRAIGIHRHHHAHGVARARLGRLRQAERNERNQCREGDCRSSKGRLHVSEEERLMLNPQLATAN